MKDKKKARCCSDKGPEETSNLEELLNNYTLVLTHQPPYSIEVRIKATERIARELFAIRSQDELILRKTDKEYECR